jgi:alanine racemase
VRAPASVPVRPPIEERLAAARLPPLPRLAWLELDLDALVANLATLRAAAGGVAAFPVVKADAYGHGAIPIARALVAGGADGLSVATVDEAVALREAGIESPIRVLYPAPPEVAAEAARRRIILAAGDRTTLAVTLAAMERAAVGRTDGAARLELEIEVETGLGRGGARPDDVPALARAIEASPVATLVGLWTHLQASEDGPRTSDQLGRFEAASTALRAAGITVPARHVAASGGILTQVPGFDGIRPGLSIYGIGPDELADDRLAEPGASALAALRPVMSIRARPARVADLPAGHGISYGPSFTTSRPSRIATLPLGYGDGFARAYANRAEALVRGQRVPLVGNITMDAVMADVTDVPGEPVTTADEFVLLGSQGSERISAEDLAQLRTTNTWEVVTQMSGRMPRVYHAAAGAVALTTLTERRG